MIRYVQCLKARLFSAFISQIIIIIAKFIFQIFLIHRWKLTRLKSQKYRKRDHLAFNWIKLIIISVPFIKAMVIWTLSMSKFHRPFPYSQKKICSVYTFNWGAPSTSTTISIILVNGTWKFSVKMIGDFSSFQAEILTDYGGNIRCRLLTLCI